MLKSKYFKIGLLEIINLNWKLKEFWEKIT